MKHHASCPWCHGTGEVRDDDRESGEQVDPCPAMEADEIYERDWREKHEREAERV